MKTNANDQFDAGFTLVEVMIAVAVLTIGLLSLFSMQVASIRGNSKANHLTTASTWNIDQIEKIIGMQYASFEDIDGDGQGNTMDSNGVDSAGVNFGLDDVTTGTGTNADADGTVTTVDGRYTLFWNIAVDVPMENLKTIKVYVIDNVPVLSRPVTFTYIKADLF